MTFDSSKPQPGIILSSGRVVTQANFAGVETYIARDHVSLDANSADSGKHKALRLTEQAAPATLVNEMGLYAKDTGTQPDLFVRRELSGTEIQMTTGDPLKAANGYSFLPGGLVIQWGKMPSVSKHGTALTFPKEFTTTCYSLTLTTFDAFEVAMINTLSKTGANIKQHDSTNRAVYWIAIGD